MTRIAAIAGDGIGPERSAPGCRSCTQFPWGCTYYLEHGQMMAEDDLKTWLRKVKGEFSWL